MMEHGKFTRPKFMAEIIATTKGIIERVKGFGFPSFGFVTPPVNWPPFRPDTRHSSEGLGISSSRCLCRMTISGLN